MLRCEDCSNLMLDYLYGLLDPEEQGQLRAHLADCPACQKALSQSEKQRRLLAQAALIYTTIPPFVAPDAASMPAEPPAPMAAEASVSAIKAPLADPDRLARVPEAAEEADQAESQATVPLPVARGRRQIFWLSAALAAAVLLAVTGLSTWYQHELSRHRAAVAAAEQQVRQIEARYASLSSEFQKQAKTLSATLREQHLCLQVQGPRSYSPAAPNKYRLATRNLADQPVQADIQFRITSAEGKDVVLERNVKTKDGQAVVEVPAGLQLPPQTILEARASANTMAARVQEHLQPTEPEMLTHLALNKTAYYTGEVLFFRSLTLERFSLRPLQKTFVAEYVLLDGNGKEVRKLTGSVRPEGIGGGEFALTSDLADGEYTLQMRLPLTHARGEDKERGQSGEVLASQRIQIWRDPGGELEFDRLQYRPGDKVAVQFRNRRLQRETTNQNLPFVAKLIVEDTTKDKEWTAEAMQGRTDHLGNANFLLQLPPKLSPASRAQLEFEYHDGTRTEKLVQSIPVLPADPMMEVFPEGGQLVGGLPGRVYFRVRGTAVDRTPVEGVVIDSRGQTVTTFKSSSLLPQQQLHDRTGFLELTPQAGECYRLKTTVPAGLALEVPLPEAAQEGVVLGLDNPVAREGEPIRLTLRSTRPNHNLLVVATCRGRVVDQRQVAASPEGVAAVLEPVTGTRGVIRLTVYEPRPGFLSPLAERLLFRQPNEQLELTLLRRAGQMPPVVAPQGDMGTYPPGAKVKVQVQAADEKQRPAETWMLLAVVEESALGLGDYRQTQGLPAHFLLTTAVRQPADLEDAGILLAPTAAATAALDHFLATAGWRRFVRRPVPPTEKGGAAALAEETRLGRDLMEQAALFWKDNRTQEQAQWQATLAAQLAKLEDATEKQRQQLQDQKQEQVRALVLARGELTALEEQGQFWLRVALAVVLMAVLLVGLVSLALGLWRVLRHRGVPTAALATSCCCLLVFLVVYQATSSWQIHEVVGNPLANNLTLIQPELLPLPRPELLLSREEGTGQRGTAPLPDSALCFVEIPRESRVQQLAALPRPNLDLLARYTLPRLYRDLDARQGPKSVPVQPSKNNAMTKRFQEAQKLQSREGAPTTSVPPKSSEHGGTRKTPAPGFGKSKGGGGEGGGGDGKVADDPLREFAYWHPHQGIDHQDTLLWHPALHAPQGRVEVQFDLPNTLSTYRILILGHTRDGRLSHREGRIQVRP